MARLNYKEVLKGDQGVTYIPHMKDTILYWTNDGNLPNPKPVNIKGKDGNMLQEEEIEKLKKNKIDNDKIYGLNDKISDFGILNLANFAMQGSPTAPIGFIMHHYTDGNVLQIDNVGQWNTILTLKNANNPIRRPDKPPLFCGSGVFVRFKDTFASMGSVIERDIFGVLEKGEIMNYSFPTIFQNNSEDLGEYLYQFTSEKIHRNLWQLKNKDKPIIGVSHDYNNNLVIIDFPEQVEALTLNLNRLNINAPIVVLSNTNMELKQLSLNECLTLKGVNQSKVNENSIFIDESDNKLKFKDNLGNIKEILLGGN